MGRLRLIGWLSLIVGVSIGITGFYLRFGLEWALMVLGVLIVAIGLTMANIGSES